MVKITEEHYFLRLCYVSNVGGCRIDRTDIKRL